MTAEFVKKEELQQLDNKFQITVELLQKDMDGIKETLIRIANNMDKIMEKTISQDHLENKIMKHKENCRDSLKTLIIDVLDSERGRETKKIIISIIISVAGFSALVWLGLR